MQKTINGELRKSPMSKFYLNSVDRRDLMSIRSVQNMEKIQRLDFFKINKNHYLSLAFNQPCCHGNSTHLSQNAGISTSVTNLDSCKKRAPKHK